MSPVELVLSKVKKARRSGQGWVACCPAHDDQHASLSVTDGQDGRALLKCHANCALESIVHAMDLSTADLFVKSPRPPDTRVRQVTETYKYRDESGTLLFEVVRYQPKDFRQRRPDGTGGYIWKLEGVRRVLYRLPELLASDPDEWVFIVEGEKDANALADRGLVATTCPQGAGKWGKLSPEWREHLRGRRLAIIPDNDPAGTAHAQEVARECADIASEVRTVALPGVPDRGDVSDYFGAGGTVESLLTLTAAAPVATTPAGPALADHMAAESPWPEAPDAAIYHGLAGDIVRAIEPHTEADPVALLVQLLGAFGSAAGRHCYFMADGARHYPNIFNVLVGTSSKGRKGTSWSHIERLFSTVDPAWADSRVLSGLSSGEGLIWAVRDPIYRTESVKEKGKPTGEMQQVLQDEGVADKRMLVLEAEFASVLRVLQREANTLSATVREAWDKGQLRTMSKNSPAKATDAHICIFGHITAEELRRYLDRTETANGFANRFLWFCVKRSKCLPDGGQIDRVDFSSMLRRLAAALQFANTPRELRRDDKAREVWHEVYPALSEGEPGLSGAILARAEAQVMRLAMIYALLDQSVAIRVEHLKAALALWEYCDASVRHIFGSSTGDEVADTIRRALGTAANGLSRTDIHKLFGRHQTAERIDRALQRLRSAGLARLVSSKTRGRSEDRWFANAKKAKEAE